MPNSNFKIPRDVIVLTGKHHDPHLRGSIRRAFIKAIVDNNKQVKESPKTQKDKVEPKPKKK